MDLLLTLVAAHRAKELVFVCVSPYPYFKAELSSQYWKNPGPLARAGLVSSHIGVDRFLALVNAVVQAVFSFGGVEMVALYALPLVLILKWADEKVFRAAAETENPRRNVKKAVHRVFYRILIFYVGHFSSCKSCIN